MPTLSTVTVPGVQPILRSAKHLLLRTFPWIYYMISGLRNQRKWVNRHGKFQSAFAAAVFDGRDIAVLSGPFRGMLYFNETVWGPITPKWIGFYESELHEIIERIVETRYDTVVDIGAAEGYYAVGIARRSAQSRVVTYDVDPFARKRQRRLANINGVTNLDVKSRCSHASLTRDVCGKTAIICDIEGAEVALLDPELCNGLRSCDILVEVHSAGSLTTAEVARVLIRRFSDSHHVQQLSVVERDLDEIRRSVPGVARLSDEDLIKALDEHRNRSQVWLWMNAR